MKKLIAIFFLSVILLGTTELYQVLKVPALISHYFEHAEEDNYSFIEFLKIHYNKAFDLDKDWKKDMKLPFKHTADQTVAQVMVSSNNFLKVNHDRYFVEASCAYNYLKNKNLPKPNVSDIWQPPRA